MPDPAVSLCADLIIDATVSHSITTYLDTLAGGERKALIAQVATDVSSGTLGSPTSAHQAPCSDRLS